MQDFMFPRTHSMHRSDFVQLLDPHASYASSPKLHRTVDGLLQVIDCIQPDDNEIVVPKTSSSVFTTTNIDTLLRNLEVKQLILAGCLTDQCVESAVRDACDLNYKVPIQIPEHELESRARAFRH